MSQLDERIAQFRKMASDDPENELGHFRLGKLLQEAGQHDEAAASFRRTLELSPAFSKVYELLGHSLVQQGKKDEAIKVLTEGFAMADERGDHLPRDEMSKLLVQLGQPAPEPKRHLAPTGAGTGFRCQRPGCIAGGNARQMPKAPMGDELGQQIYEKVCADCWNDWLRNLSVKVINEMRLDFTQDKNVEIYDQIMRETLGLT